MFDFHWWQWIGYEKKEFLFKMLEWITLAIVIVLAISSFHAAMSPKEQENFILSSGLPKIILGFSMSAVSPAQIPFWFGWSTVLLTKKILLPINKHYNFYIIGIGLGTLIGNCVFIFGGRLVADKLKNSHHIINWVIGGIFLVTALIQIWKMTKKKTTAHKFAHRFCYLFFQYDTGHTNVRRSLLMPSHNSCRNHKYDLAPLLPHCTRGS